MLQPSHEPHFPPAVLSPQDAAPSPKSPTPHYLPANAACVVLAPAISPSGAYSPGPIRSASDREQTAVSAFLTHHPEYSSLPLCVIQQYMSADTRLADRRAALRRDNGIPEDWRRRRDDDCGPMLAEECA